MNFQSLANFIWSVADLLRGPYRPPQYERVMLPMTVLRRFDCVLELTKDKVLKKHKQLEASGKVKNPDATLNAIAKDEEGRPLGFHNHSPLDFQKLTISNMVAKIGSKNFIQWKARPRCSLTRVYGQ